MARNKALNPKVSPINQFAVEWWDIERPKDYPLNARKWKPAAVEKVAASIKAYGWRQPIVVDEAGVIVIGHLRRAAARHAGLKQVPVHIAADLSPEAIRGLRLADNRTHDEAEWDMELLAREFGELKALDFDLYDPFLGSGTTIIAAESVGRRCLGLEIEPAYCDVIVKRWENLTGKKATRA